MQKENIMRIVHIEKEVKCEIHIQKTSTCVKPVSKVYN
jgi:hypothetical protein